MNPYNFIPQNLPPSLIPSYLQRMGYQQPGVEQDLLMLSQMYSQYPSSGSTSAYGALGSLFNSATGGGTNPLFNSTSGGGGNYYKSNMSPITTSSSSAYTNNMTTPMSPSVYNGISPLPSTSPTQSQNMMYNLARLMPSYAGLTGLTGSSNQATTSSRPSTSSNTSAFPPSYNLYGNSTNATSTNNAQQLPTTQPGPNAIKNPLLSNLLPPATNNTKDAFSIPTSVITKASKDLQRATHTSTGTVNRNSPVSLSPTHASINRSSAPTNATSHASTNRSNATNTINQPSTSRPSSAHSNHSSPSPGMTKSTPTSRGNPLNAARSSPSVAVSKNNNKQSLFQMNISKNHLRIVPENLNLTVFLSYN